MLLNHSSGLFDYAGDPVVKIAFRGGSPPLAVTRTAPGDERRTGAVVRTRHAVVLQQHQLHRPGADPAEGHPPLAPTVRAGAHRQPLGLTHTYLSSGPGFRGGAVRAQVRRPQLMRLTLSRCCHAALAAFANCPQLSVPFPACDRPTLRVAYSFQSFRGLWVRNHEAPSEREPTSVDAGRHEGSPVLGMASSHPDPDERRAIDRPVLNCQIA